MYSIDEVCTLADGLEPKTLRNWIGLGLIVPNQAGRTGRGGAHRFAQMHTVGIIVAQYIRNSRRSCVPAYFAEVAACFNATDEKWLIKEMKSGKQWFVKPHYNRPILAANGEEFDWPYVPGALQF